MTLPTKSFLLILIITSVVTATAYFLSQKEIPLVVPESSAPVQEVEQTPEVTDGSVPLTPESGPFNAEGVAREADKAQFGYIKAVEVNPETKEVSITFDQALWYFGDEAEKLAREDLGCNKANAPEECSGGSILNNPYYIQNPIKRDLKYKLDQSAVIKLISYIRTDGLGIKEVGVEDLQKYLEETDPHNADGSTVIPFWIVIDKGVVNYIEEQYIP